MQQDDSLLNEFLQESRDHLASIETDLLILEETGANADEELVNKVFRAAHSIKGSSGMERSKVASSVPSRGAKRNTK